MAKSGKIQVNQILAIVLMAGKGTRMKSDKPKVLHEMVGHPMGWFVLKALDRAGIKNRLIVTGYGKEAVESEFPGEKFVHQEPQLGTGHAVMVTRKAIPQHITHLLIVNGDNPLLTPHTSELQSLL